jgi:predicted RNA methylase
VREGLMAERAAWEAERLALAGLRTPSVQAIEKDLLSPDAAARRQARLRLQGVEARVASVRKRRLQLVAWIRNPGRMIWAKHAELNALAKARSEVRRAELRLEIRQAWLRSSPGQALVAARRQPSLDRAAEGASKRRTLVRKIKRMDRRIDAATRTLSDLMVAQELGQRQLRVPTQSPDATRFIRDVGAPARAAIARYPAPARQQAIERLNRGQGRSIAKTLFPGR